MELATAALSSLLPKLGTLLSDEYKLQKGVRGEIKFLKAEMESMQAALNDLSQLPADRIDNLDKIWMRNLKELSYDIEDSVDAFMVRVDAPAKPPSLKVLRRFIDKIGFVNTAKTRHKIAIDFKDIKRRTHEVTDMRARYKFNGASVQPDSMAMDPRMPALYQDVKMLVGIDGPAQKLTNLLTQGEGVQKQQLMVVSIFGMGGLGKTTLANSVYRTLRGQFECQAFVSVSLKPNMEKIFSSILRQVSGMDYANSEAWSHTELIDKIRKIIEKKRYIIVIDDLWDVSAWTHIKCALVDNDLGSRVIVTTRNVDVATCSCSPMDGSMYELDPLSDADSKRLFYKRIFSDEEGIHSELEEVMKKILKKCGGVPLAIITIASMLASIPSKTKYAWYVVYNSMGSGLENDKSLENMRKILYLSYGDLPSYLKPCLLHLSMFPEDYEIQGDRLVKMWVAEGFVDAKQGSNLYDHGETYFNELVNRSMIQPIGVDESGNPQGCRVHDMILDLIISISAEENFVTIVECPQLISPDCKVRRLSLQGSKVDSKEEQVILATTMNLSHVRSLITFGDAFQWMPPLSRFSVLRVLSLNDFPSKKNHLKDLGSLHHLRYLELGGDLETELVEEIGNLQLLKTLDLWAASIEELPASIVQLRQLERLIIGTGVKLPYGIGNLTSLQELSWLDAGHSPNTLAEIGNLTDLRVLSCSLYINESYEKTFLQSLSNLGNLRILNLCGHKLCSLDCIPDRWRGPARLQSFDGDLVTISRLPRWFSSLSELSCLFIKVLELRQDDLQLLGSLPVLRFLKLQVAFNGTCEEGLVIGSDHPFRSLEEFRVKLCTRCLPVFAQGVMPKLQRLQLYFEVTAREVGWFDTGLNNLTSLKHITVKVDYSGDRIEVVENAETTIRDAIDIHPNHPTLQLSRVWE